MGHGAGREDGGGLGSGATGNSEDGDVDDDGGGGKGGNGPKDVGGGVGGGGKVGQQQMTELDAGERLTLSAVRLHVPTLERTQEVVTKTE